MLDLTKYTARDVIEHVLELCPTMLTEKLTVISEQHESYSTSSRNAQAALTAKLMAIKASECVSAIVGNVDIKATAIYLCDNLSRKIIVFGAACDILGVPRSLRGDIITRPDDSEPLEYGENI